MGHILGGKELGQVFHPPIFRLSPPNVMDPTWVGVLLISQMRSSGVNQM